MTIASCPHCQTPLTASERNRHDCPTCYGTLNSVKSKNHPVYDVGRGNRATSASVSWIAFISLLGLCLVLLLIGPMIGSKLNEFGRDVLAVSFAGLLLLSFVPLHRLMNRPMLHLPWYRRPERIVMVFSMAVVAAIWGMQELNILPLNFQSMSVGIVAFCTAMYTMRIRRLR